MISSPYRFCSGASLFNDTYNNGRQNDYSVISIFFSLLNFIVNFKRIPCNDHLLEHLGNLGNLVKRFNLLELISESIPKGNVSGVTFICNLLHALLTTDALAAHVDVCICDTKRCKVVKCDLSSPPLNCLGDGPILTTVIREHDVEVDGISSNYVAECVKCLEIFRISFCDDVVPGSVTHSIMDSS